MLVFLFLRRWPIPRYGIWPNAAEWREGIRQFTIFFALLLPIGLTLKFLKFQLPKLPLWQLPFAYLAAAAVALCFVAFGEEFFFRGVLQRLIHHHTRRLWPALILSNVLFGAVHLPFRQFPNWRFAILAAVAGVFYGLAFHRAQSLRAAMVAHALLVATWTIFFNRSL
jgi:membrane protease YdiL (CAAX protease family)